MNGTHVHSSLSAMTLGCLLTFAAGTAPASSGAMAYQGAPGAAAQPSEPIGPTTPAEMEAFIDGFMSLALRKGPVAGATVAVVKDGSLFFAKGYGYEDVDKRVPIDPDQSVFRPGSVSKLFTWTSIMQLVEQGKLDLDKDVNTYLKDVKVPATYAQPITLRNIMTHTAGFEDGAVGYLFAKDQKDLIPLSTWLQKHMPGRARSPTTDFNSGANSSYSNYATALAGHIVETVSGLPFDDYVERNIFKPLGMTHSTFREPLPPQLASRFAGGYRVENGEFKRREFEFIHSVGPAGSLSSTATDMAKFMLAYLQGGSLGDAHILAPETVRLMHTRALSPDPALNGQLLGFYETWINGRRVVGHGGDTSYFHSVLSLIPDANLGLFVSVNTGGEGARTSVNLERAFVTHYFPAKLPKLTPRKDAKERNERYAGTYRGLRRSYSKFEKVFSFGSDIKAKGMPDGSLSMGDPLSGDAHRWIEVGDGVFRDIYDDLFLAFKGDRGGHPAALVGYFPPMAAARISWWETSSLHTVVLAISVLLFITIVVSTIRRRRTDRAGPANVRWARPALGLAGLLLIVFLLGCALVATQISDLIYRIPASLYFALAFPLLAIPCVLIALFMLPRVWRSDAWRLGARLHYTLASLAVVAFLLLLNYWNLLGYRFG
jgi:CubicO group peptidase (beta-lactamase class C family)